MEIKNELIVSIVNRGQADKVVSAAKNAGANGGTIIYGRGTGKHEQTSILGISIEPEKELILTIVKVKEKEKIMTAICEGAGINNPGVGLCFSMPVTNLLGVTTTSEKYSPDIENIKNGRK